MVAETERWISGWCSLDVRRDGPLADGGGPGEHDEPAAPAARAVLGPARVEERAQRAALAGAEPAEPLDRRDLAARARMRSRLPSPIAGRLVRNSVTRIVPAGDAGSANARRSSSCGVMTRIATSLLQRGAGAPCGDGATGCRDPVDFGWRAGASGIGAPVLVRRGTRCAAARPAGPAESRLRLSDAITHGAAAPNRAAEVGRARRPGDRSPGRGSGAGGSHGASPASAQSTVAPITNPMLAHEPSAVVRALRARDLGDDADRTPSARRSSVAALRGEAHRGCSSRRARTRPCRTPRRAGTCPRGCRRRGTGSTVDRVGLQRRAGREPCFARTRPSSCRCRRAWRRRSRSGRQRARRPARPRGRRSPRSRSARRTRPAA